MRLKWFTGSRTIHAVIGKSLKNERKSRSILWLRFVITLIEKEKMRVVRGVVVVLEAMNEWLSIFLYYLLRTFKSSFTKLWVRLLTNKRLFSSWLKFLFSFDAAYLLLVFEFPKLMNFFWWGLSAPTVANRY